jgi:hypothetical protein
MLELVKAAATIVTYGKDFDETDRKNQQEELE